jgi:hypothetical protein
MESANLTSGYRVVSPATGLLGSTASRSKICLVKLDDGSWRVSTKRRHDDCGQPHSMSLDTAT